MAKDIAKWHPKLAKWRASMESRKGIQDVFVTPTFNQDCINTGSTVINMLIGGSRLDDGRFVCPGYPKGSIIEIYGRESSGKSTLALTAMGQAIAQNSGQGCGLYVDLECAVKDFYAMKLGVDFRDPKVGGPGSAQRVSPHSFEETETLVMGAALMGVDLIVIDSVAGLVSKREVMRDKDNDKEKAGIAEVPRLMSKWLPQLQNVISRTKTCVIFLNQTRDKIGAGPMAKSEEAKKTTTGGNALKFWASIRVFLKPRMSTKAKIFNPIIKSFEDVQISTDVEIKMIKNKIDAKQGHSGLVTIRYGVGVDELRTMLNVAEAYDIVIKTKNKQKKDIFTFKSPGNGEVIEETGLEKFRLTMTKTHGGEPMKEMINLCTERIMHGFRMLDDQELAALSDDAVTKREDDDDYDAGEDPVEIDSDEEGGDDDEGHNIQSSVMDIEV